MQTNYSWDELDAAAEREGMMIAAHRRATPARPVTRGDCKRKGMVRGCQAAKDRMSGLNANLAVKVSYGLRLGSRARLSGLVST
jgi:hypothetical protein